MANLIVRQVFIAICMYMWILFKFRLDVVRQAFKSEKNLKFLLQKVLKQSDVNNLGRIVLPKVLKFYIILKWWTYMHLVIKMWPSELLKILFISRKKQNVIFHILKQEMEFQLPWKISELLVFGTWNIGTWTKNNFHCRVTYIYVTRFNCFPFVQF